MLGLKSFYVSKRGAIHGAPGKAYIRRGNESSSSQVMSIRLFDAKSWLKSWSFTVNWTHGPLTRYVKLQVAHAPGMPGTFSPAADFKGNRKLAIPTCVTARAWRTCRDACRDRAPAVTGKTFPAFPAHAHLQFCVSGKRPMGTYVPENDSIYTSHLW